MDNGSKIEYFLCDKCSVVFPIIEMILCSCQAMVCEKCFYSSEHENHENADVLYKLYNKEVGDCQGLI